MGRGRGGGEEVRRGARRGFTGEDGRGEGIRLRRRWWGRRAQEGGVAGAVFGEMGDREERVREGVASSEDRGGGKTRHTRGREGQAKSWLSHAARGWLDQRDNNNKRPPSLSGDRVPACLPLSGRFVAVYIDREMKRESFRIPFVVEMNEWMNEGWKTTLAALSTDLLQNNLSQTGLLQCLDLPTIYLHYYNEKKKRPRLHSRVVIGSVMRIRDTSKTPRPLRAKCAGQRPHRHRG